MPTSVRNSQAAQAHGQSTSIIIASFGGIQYYVDPTPAKLISFRPSRPSDGFFNSLNGDLGPCTVIDYSNDHLNKQNLDNIISNIALHDDVWTSAFTQGETSRRHQSAIEFDCLQ